MLSTSSTNPCVASIHPRHGPSRHHMHRSKTHHPSVQVQVPGPGSRSTDREVANNEQPTHMSYTVRYISKNHSTCPCHTGRRLPLTALIFLSLSLQIQSYTTTVQPFAINHFQTHSVPPNHEFGSMANPPIVNSSPAFSNTP